MDKVIEGAHFFMSNNSHAITIFKNKYTEWEDKTHNHTAELFQYYPCLNQNFVKLTDEIALFHSYKLGSGAFGKVYYGLDFIRRKELAIKIQSTKIANDLLAKENYFLNQLREAAGFPTVHFYGEWKGHKVLAQDLLGPSLDKIFKFCQKQFKISTVIRLGLNMFDLLEVMHRNNILHRDIKPNNFVYGTYDSKFKNYHAKIHLIDFGLSCVIHDSNGKHSEWNNKSLFVGTPRYASVNTHNGIRQSRRDDLESLAYVLIYFAKGSLPWQGVKAKNKDERKEMIKNIKKSVDPMNLCEGLPNGFIALIKEIKKLTYDEKPDYNFLRQLIMGDTEKQRQDNSQALWEWEDSILNDFKINDNKNPQETINELFEGYPFDYNKYINLLTVKKCLSSISNKK